ncbi:MAG: hypothetical protein P8I03_15550 [Thalassotalea sp.]|nr:hypothetical protein [Thalassotalea sp.]
MLNKLTILSSHLFTVKKIISNNAYKIKTQLAGDIKLSVITTEVIDESKLNQIPYTLEKITSQNKTERIHHRILSKNKTLSIKGNSAGVLSWPEQKYLLELLNKMKC